MLLPTITNSLETYERMEKLNKEIQDVIKNEMGIIKLKNTKTEITY